MPINGRCFLDNEASIAVEKKVGNLPGVKIRKSLKKLFKKGASAGRFLGQAIAYLILSLIGRVYPRSRSSVVVLAPEHGSFADNAKYAYLRLSEEEDLWVTYITTDKDVSREIKKEGINAEVYPSRAAAAALLRAGAVVGVMGKSFEGVRGHLTAGASKIQLWHGEGVKKVQLGQREGEPGKISPAEKIKWCISRRHSVYDLIFFPTEEQYQRRKNWFLYRRYLIDGMIRNDLLRGRDFGPGAEVYADRGTLDRIRALKAGGARLVLYAPTRRRRGQPAFGDRIPFDFTVADDMLRRQDSYLVVKLHPRMKERVDFDLFKRVMEYSKLKDIYPALGLFDCLITDYSSIANDYKIYQRPVIRYFPDYERVISSGMISEEAYREMPGTLYLKFRDMLKGLEQILEGAGGERPVPEAGSFSGDRLVKEIRLLLEGGGG